MSLDTDVIKQVLIEQMDEAESFKSKPLVQRDLYQEAKKQLSRSWIKVVMGVRRCGKSVFCHQLLADAPYHYVNFDDERLIGLTSQDLNQVLQILLEIQPGVKVLFFDEIQNVEGWELFVNRLQRQNYQILITGSNSKMLSKELATHLTGRVVSISLEPFSFREFLRSHSFTLKAQDVFRIEKKALLLNHLETYGFFGGFPEMVLNGYHPEYLRELYDKIITRDIVYRYQIKYGKTLKELALYSFSNFGNRMTYHKVKNIFDLNSVHTVKNYFQYLEDAYLISLLKPFSYKVKEQIRLPRKLYTVDNGLSRAVNPKFTADRGAALENLVFQELIRRKKEIYYVADPKYEVDFVVKTDREVTLLIQVAYTLSNPETKNRELKSLFQASDDLKCKGLLLLTWDEDGEERQDGKTILICPVWKWLLLEPDFNRKVEFH